MKKLLALLFIFALSLSSSLVSADSIFTNNKELDKTFQQLEKSFMQAEKLESVPSKIIAGKIYSKKMPKMPDKLIRAAVQQKLNDIRAAIEIQEEKLGGLSTEEYKIISTKLLDNLIIAGKGSFHWEDDLKSIYLYFGLSDDEYFEFDGLVGNFKRMGKEKDEVSEEDLRVKDTITRYLNQSIQKGNKVSPQILKQLPVEMEKFFVETRLSKILAGRLLAEIHWEIYTPFQHKYDGTESVETIMESYEDIDFLRETRDFERQVEEYTFSKDSPSEDFREYIIEQILKGELSEHFASGFNDTITVDELARLYFEGKEINEKIELDDNTIDSDAPDYIKNAFIYGMIDDEKDLSKPLTRLEATKRLVNGLNTYNKGVSIIRVLDCAKVPFKDLVSVGSCLNGGMSQKGLNFEPQKSYTKQDAIIDRPAFRFYNIRGFEIPKSYSSLSKIVVGRNSIHLQYESKEDIDEYVEDYFEESDISKIKKNGSYLRIDTGCALIELYTPENGVKFTIKNGVGFVDFEEGTYGPKLQYKIEARVLKANEKVDMNIQPDSTHKKIQQRLDAILAKTIKSGMTQEQKIKAIHDFVVKHITYDSNYADDETAENLLITIDKGRGVCGDYTLFFQYLCDRAGIPCIDEAGYVRTSSSMHAWNVVFINGQWKYIDTTWDDVGGKVIYRYYLVDKFTFMKDHNPLMGVPREESKYEIDGMNIKNLDELRVYVLRKFYWIDGFKMTFRMSDKKMKPNVDYIWPTAEVRVELKYDAKQDLYTLSSKKR